MSRPKLARREFLKAAGVALAAPAIIPTTALGRDGRAAPSERIVLGATGTGGRGQQNVAAFLALPDVQVVAVCDVDRKPVEAAAGLAELLLDAGDQAGAEAILDAVPDDKKASPSLAAARAKLALAAQTASLGDPAALERRLAENPKDHDARFDLAMIDNARGEREKAAERLLEIVKADRTWRDDGAKAQLLQFFEAWGMTDEATLAARRKLSSVLFS